MSIGARRISVIESGRDLASPLIAIPALVTKGVVMRGAAKVTTSAGTVGLQSRVADRRGGILPIIRQVAADLIGTTARRNLAVFLTQRLARLDGIRSIRLNEIEASTPTRSLQPIRARDYVAFMVPVKEPGRQVMLEAAFDSRRGPDEWTCQIIEAAAHLAALLIEAERLASSPAPLTAADRDGAAPLIGSSDVMQALRERVERVAGTDFTVLIEGSSEREGRPRPLSPVLSMPARSDAKP